MPISIGFSGEHLTEVAAFMSEYLEVNVVVDPRAVRGLKLELQAPLLDPHDHAHSQGVRHTLGVCPTPWCGTVSRRRTPPEESVLRMAEELPLTGAQVTYGMVEPITFDETPLHEMLTQILEPLGLAYSVEPYYIWVSTPGRLGDGAHSAVESAEANPVLEEDLMIPITKSFDEAHLTDIIYWLSEEVEENIAVDTRVVVPSESSHQGQSTTTDDGFVTDGVVPYINIYDVPLQAALTALLRPLDLDFRLEPYFIWVSTPERLASEPIPPHFPREDAPPTIAYSQLEECISLGFIGEHITEILDFVSEYMEINVHLDTRVVAPVVQYPIYPLPDLDFTPPLPQPPHVATTVTDGIVSYAKLNEVPLHTTLAGLLRPLDLTYEVQDHHIWISSPALIAKDKARTVYRPEQEALDALVALPDRGARLTEALYQIGEEAGVEIALNAGYQAGTMEQVIAWWPSDAEWRSPVELPAGEALDMLLRVYGLQATYQNDRVYIGTELQLAQGDFASWKLAALQPPPENEAPPHPLLYFLGVIEDKNVKTKEPELRAAFATTDPGRLYGERFRVGKEIAGYRIDDLDLTSHALWVSRLSDGEILKLSPGQQLPVLEDYKPPSDPDLERRANGRAPVL